MSNHSFPVDARCNCGVAMSFLIREGQALAKCAAGVLRASIEQPDSKLDMELSALNLALLRYSAATHMEGRVGVVLGEMDEFP